MVWVISTFTALWCVIYLHTLHWSNTADGRNPELVDINYHHLQSFIHLRCLAGFLPSTVSLRKVIASSTRTLRLLTIYYNKVLQVDKSVVQLVPSNITYLKNFVQWSGNRKHWPHHSPPLPSWGSSLSPHSSRPLAFVAAPPVPAPTPIKASRRPDLGLTSPQKSDHVWGFQASIFRCFGTYVGFLEWSIAMKQKKQISMVGELN